MFESSVLPASVPARSRQSGSQRALRAATVLGVGLSLFAVGCTPLGAGEGEGPAWPPLSKKWYDRALVSYRAADIEDAETSIDNALRITPEKEEVKLLGARVALAKLDYDRTVKLLNGVDSQDARSIRGRALWYAGNIDQAADELEALLADPSVRDEWAENVAKLARRGGGRSPFTLSGLLGYGEMPRISASNMSLVIPVEVNGEEALGLVHTGYAETVVDGSGDPTWISLRFGDSRQPGASHLEVKDVPAITKDLSGLSRGLNAPIKVLLGVNLLRHLHPTFDFEGGQFVVRSFEPPPPPAATTVHVNYVRGGGMVLRSALGRDAKSPQVALFVDTSMNFPFAFADPGWKKAGVALSSLRPVPGAPQLKSGVIPFMQIGAFELPKVEAVHLEDAPKDLEIEIDGTIGAPLLAAFRVTLFDGGRSMWLEDHATLRDGSPPGPPDEAPDTELPSPADVPVVPEGPGVKAPQLAPPDVAGPEDAEDEAPSKPPGAAKPPAKKK
ncbi:MAG: hypothetical protein AB7K71_11145 [Polyangiaceae bacterium]